MMSDRPRARNIPSSRISRLTRLGSMTASVAGNMAIGSVGQLGRGRKPVLRDLLLTPSNMHRIANELAKMRGAAMKIGQLMSMDTGDALPPELSQILGRLRADADFMPPAQLKKVLNSNWPKNWLREFAKFDVRPIAAASIGQVHRATLKDGREMAIKVQYPGVAKSIDSDVANVGALIRMSGLLPKGFEIEPYLDEACKQLHEETDYKREGSYLARFGVLLANDQNFTLPDIQPDWTTPDILAMTFVAGRPIEDATDLPQEERDRIATHLIDLTLRELFAFQLMQTDPNFANYRYDTETGRIVLLDFGAAREIDPEIASLYRDLLIAGLTKNDDALRNISVKLGFFDADTPSVHVDQIMRMIKLIFSGLKAEDIFDFAQTDMPRQMQAEGQKLAESGFVPPQVPIDVLYLQRKFGGMFLLASRLKARVDVVGLLRNQLGEVF